jgi:hypothetical protein
MIITVPTAQLCIKSEAPAMVVPVVEKTLYERLQIVGPALLRAYGIQSRAPPKAA